MKNQNRQVRNDNPSAKDGGVNVGRDVSDSVVVTGNGNVVSVGDRTWLIIALFAIILCLGIIVVLQFPLFLQWFFPPIAPTLTPVPVNPTEPFVEITANVTEWEATPTLAPVDPFTPTPEGSGPVEATPNPAVDRLAVVLSANMTEGKAPLRVNFDARSSYIQFANDGAVPCGDNIYCSYVFTVRHDGDTIYTSTTRQGLFSYTFGARGEYFVAVYVCRGDVCDSDGLEIVVR